MIQGLWASAFTPDVLLVDYLVATVEASGAATVIVTNLDTRYIQALQEKVGRPVVVCGDATGKYACSPPKFRGGVLLKCRLH